MAQDPLRLIAQPADQQSTLTLVAQPAGQSQSAPISYAPHTWLDLPQPVTVDPEAVEPAPRSLGRIRMPVRVLFLIVVGSAALVGWFYLLRETNAYNELGWQWYLVAYLAGTSVLMILCWALLPRWILRRHGSSELVAWRRPTRQDFNWLTIGLALLVGFWFLYWQIIPWTGWEWALPVQPPDDANVVVFAAWWHAAILAIQVVIVAPYVEETFFRGFMLGALNRVWWLVPSLVLSAVVFSALHFNLRLIIPFAIGGLIFGAMYLRTKHLTAPAMAHAGWNLGVTVFLLMEYGVG